MKNYYFLMAAVIAGNSAFASPLGMPKLFTAAEAPEVSNEIIYEAPEGEVKFYTEAYDGWVFYGEWVGLQYMSGGRTTNKIVWCEDGKVYIQNPVAVNGTGSFAVGTYADGKITVQLPQCIGGYYDETGAAQYMYLNKMEEVEQDGEKYYMICYPEDNYLVYDVDENGNITLNLGNDPEAVDIENGQNPKYLVGNTYENEPHALQVWSGYGDAFETWTLIDNGDPVTPPADVASQYWAFDTYGKKSIIEVKIDGDDIYLNGFTSYIVGYWIKGTIERDNKIVIPSKQYMGKNEYDQFHYFLATKVIPATDPNSWDTYEMIDQITMNYNPDTKTYSAPGEAFCVSTSKDYVAYMALAGDPILWEQAPEMLNAAPENPSLTSFTPFNPETLVGSMVWDIPNINVNGAILRGEQMYYNLYVDGELFVFYTDEYPLFTEPTTDVPYDAGDFYNIFSYDTSHTITYKFSDLTTVGLQSFYKADDGTVYSSDLITYDIEEFTGVDSAEIMKEVSGVTYYTISGMEVSDPASGLYIKRTVYTDGTHTTEKVVVR